MPLTLAAPLHENGQNALSLRGALPPDPCYRLVLCARRGPVPPPLPG